MRLQDDHEHKGDILKATESIALRFLESLSTRPSGCAIQELSHDALPDEGMGAVAAITMFRDKYEAQLSGSPGPRYLGFVTGGSTPAALAGDWLTAAYDQNLAIDGDSVAMTVERETLNMLRDLFGIPEQFEGVFVSGATQANLVSLATARQWAAHRLGADVTEQGLWSMSPLPVLGGAPHASILKALSILGMGRQSFHNIACLECRQAVDPSAVAQHLAALAGKPAIVVASAGEVNTGDFDDIEALSEICKA
jgi:glutamate/tyrosine decarboxylase-like PLP-dependent enzyme